MAPESTLSEWTGSQIAALLELPHVGQQTVRSLIEWFPSPEQYDPNDLRLHQLRPQTFRALPDKLPAPLGLPEGISIIGPGDATYPPLLKLIPDWPPALWVRGELPLGDTASRFLAVVGTRNPTEFGRRAVRAAVAAAAAHDAVIVSGLALGCDTLAHETALELGLRTIAVLGSSVAVPQPRSNGGLALEILKSGGALISEQPMDRGSAAYGLVQRNRIQTGMSLATVVAQTGIPGGTLHTAQFALTQGRPLIVAAPARLRRNEALGNAALVLDIPPHVTDTVQFLVEALELGTTDGPSDRALSILNSLLLELGDRLTLATHRPSNRAEFVHTMNQVLGE